jgi:hypothetical protein
VRLAAVRRARLSGAGAGEAVKTALANVEKALAGGLRRGVDGA